MFDLSQRDETALRACYEAVLAATQAQVDSWDAVREVERYRQLWRPAHRCSTVILAESHVYTAPEEMSDIAASDLCPDHRATGKYVRFIYCLAYGESRLLGRPVSRNGGTPDFWKLFWHTINAPESPGGRPAVLKGVTRDNSKRIGVKLNLLDQMKARGIWLVDASIVGIAQGVGRRHADPARLIETSWDGYVRNVLTTAAPDRVLIVGALVSRLLRKQVAQLLERGESAVMSIHQPNAQRGPAGVERKIADYLTCYSHCNAPSSLGLP